MNVQIRKRLRRFALSCIVTGAVALSPLVGSASNDRYDRDAQLFAAIKAIDAIKPETGFEQWKEWKAYLAEFVDRQMKELTDPNAINELIEEFAENEAAAANEVAVNEVAVDEVAVDEVAVDEVVVDQVAVDEVAVDEVAVDEVVVDEVVVDEVVVDEVVVDEVAVDEVVVDEATVDEVVVDQVAVDEVAVDEVVVDQVAVDEVAVDEATVNEATVNEVVVDEVVVDQVAVDEVAVDEVAVNEVVVDEVAVDEVAVDEVAQQNAADESDDAEYYSYEYYDDEYDGEFADYHGIADEAMPEADSWEEEFSDDWDTDDWYAEQRLAEESTDLSEMAQPKTDRSVAATSETVLSDMGDRCLFDHDGNYSYSWFEPKTKNEFNMIAQSEEPKEDTSKPAASNLKNSTPANTSLFVVAQSICQRVGVSVQQITEPFAMVTPTAQSTLSQIAELQQQAVAVATQLAAEDARVAAAEEAANKEAANKVAANKVAARKAAARKVAARKAAARVEIARNHRSELDSLAAERVDAYRHLGQSVLTAEAAPEPEPIVKQELASVGCSAMIVTLDDPYLPYDLASNDVPVWDFSVIATEPYDIGDRQNHVEIDELPNDEFRHDELVSTDPEVARDDVLLVAEQEVAEQEVVQENEEERFEANKALASLSARIVSMRESTLPLLQQWSAATLRTNLALIEGVTKQAVDQAIDKIGKVWPKNIEEPMNEAELQVAELPTETDAR
ncbi:hypothetical protein Q31b_41770 [Novipirellula aureliae]|uniref:Uncharacterized protein n=1 Tax=Novipirellula aureliae TaxID=2527966 RepID=A0A5C6DS67_9BACT|nr:hypothetical protein [Novipirellula aureliae]TWU39095.1 hypothetical protein Q31b_41770 [Novipirellula aureliae]